jgi:hypothetical protein
VLLTGHSHQAWPDCAREAMVEYFDDSARLVDFRSVRNRQETSLGHRLGSVVWSPRYTR